MASLRQCACGRPSSNAYNTSNIARPNAWCCISCKRNGTHSIWCDRRTASNTAKTE